jgi:hypothetical protein
MSILIVIVAVGLKYINYTKALIDSVNKIKPSISFLVLTDSPSSFLIFSNLITINYTKKTFSYHDKLIALKEGLKKSDIVLGIDADTVLNENHNLELLNNLTHISPGIYPHFLWCHPADCSIENFLLGKNERVPYGILYKDFCVKNNLITTPCSHMQESFILIKKDKINEKNIDNFFQIWEKLANFCNEEDKKRNQSIIGYGEGYSIAIASLNSELNVFTNEININKIKDSFKHLAWQ